MTITPRGGGPLVVAGTGHPISGLLTGARSPQVNDLIIILHGNDFYALSNMQVPTVGGVNATAITNASADAGSSNAHTIGYGFVVTSAGDVTVQATETGAHDEDKVLIVWVLPGADIVNWIDGGAAGAAGSFSATGQSSFVLTGVTPVGADAFLLYHMNSGGGSSAGFPFGNPAGTTEAYDAATGGISYTGGYQQLAASGATGTRTITSGAGSPSWSGLLMAIKTASAGVVITDPVAGGGSTGGQSDGMTRGDGSGGATTGGASDGLALGDGSGGGSSSGQLDGLALGDGSGGSSSGGQSDGRALGDGSGGAATGGGTDTISASVIIADTSGGGGTGGSPDTVVSGSVVVHDAMVMPIVLNARSCLVTEVGKLQYPPSRVQIRPGALFEFQADNITNECCDGIAWVRRGVLTPTTGAWPNPQADSEVNPPPMYSVQLELGIMRCVPIAADVDGSIVTEAQWLQAAQNAEDDAAALRRVVCCLRDIYGNRAVIENPTVPLENGGMCGGQVVTLLVRAPACECVE